MLPWRCSLHLALHLLFDLYTFGVRGIPPFRKKRESMRNPESAVQPSADCMGPSGRKRRGPQDDNSRGANFLNVLQRPVWYFYAELLCVFGVQLLKAGELHCVGADRTSDRIAAEVVI